MTIKCVAISDTHSRQKGFTQELPEADLLFHAGDIMSGGWDTFEVENWGNWLKDHAHKYDRIIQIAGNHDRLFERNRKWCQEALTSRIPNLVYLEDEEYIYKGIKIYGSPITPEFCGWAFMKNRGFSIKRYWDAIPNDINILITHGPGYGSLDWVYPRGDMVGCEQLASRIRRLKKLDVHMFGHIHEARGVEVRGEVTYINASICNASYMPVNKPIVFMYDLDTRTTIILDK